MTSGIWTALQARARSSKKPAFVAVAYFGKGAAALLPLPKGSHLVVDASDGAVRSGQTCPAELLKLQKRVSIYRYPNLHAKVFVFDRTAFIGSANASNHSAKVLQEAVFQTDDSAVVGTVRRFVRDLCIDLLGPDELRRLAKIYRPPKVPGGKERRTRAPRRKLPELRIAATRPFDHPEDVLRAAEAGEKVASKRAVGGKSFEIDWFSWSGESAFQIGQFVIQVYRNGQRGSVSPPGRIVHLKRHKNRTLVYTEQTDDKWLPFSRFPPGLKKLLDRGGAKNEAATRALLTFWNRPGTAL